MNAPRQAIPTAPCTDACSDTGADSASQALRRQARRRVGRQAGFLIHLAVFLMVNLGLLAARILRGDAPTVHLPMLGWGFGLVIHGVVTLVALRSGDWYRRWVDAEARALRARPRG